jgi:hypothetical protein
MNRILRVTVGNGGWVKCDYSTNGVEQSFMGRFVINSEDRIELAEVHVGLEDRTESLLAAERELNFAEAAVSRGAGTAAQKQVQLSRVAKARKAVEDATPRRIPLSAQIRKLPVFELERIARLPEMRRQILSCIDIPGPLVSVLLSHYSTSFGSERDAETGKYRPVRNWVADSLASQVADSGIAPVGPRRRRPQRRNDYWLDKIDASLPVPGARPYGDEFYKQVADVYLRVQAVDGHPNRVMADANGVPTTTVAEWVKQARARKYLAPGQKGRVHG